MPFAFVVPSVKYVSGTDAQELKPKKGKLGLRDFFKKLANSPTKEHQHDYDVVASDEVVDAANANKTRLYLPSASSQIGQFPQRDSVSAWSESTFDGKIFLQINPLLCVRKLPKR